MTAALSVVVLPVAALPTVAGLGGGGTPCGGGIRAFFLSIRLLLECGREKGARCRGRAKEGKGRPAGEMFAPC
jgi:hypothetical protein